MHSSRALGCIARCIPRSILLQDASPADAISDDPANITQHALHERKLAKTGHAYVSQHDLSGWHQVDTAMHELFVGASLTLKPDVS